MDAGLSCNVSHDVQLQDDMNTHGITAHIHRPQVPVSCHYLQQTDVGGVIGINKEALEIGLKHVLE